MVANKVELPLRGGGGGSSGGIYVRLERNTQFGFSSVADLDPSSGEALSVVTGGGRMVVQWAADFLVGGSNPGRVHMPAASQMAFAWQGFEPPTAKTATGCATIRPWGVAVERRIPIAWILLTTNYYTMPWGMLLE